MVLIEELKQVHRLLKGIDQRHSERATSGRCLEYGGLARCRDYSSAYVHKQYYRLPPKGIGHK